jgi:cation diffusion facilitator CzcD-associated flavoprotein CzcO
VTSEVGAPSSDVVVIGASQAGLAIRYHLAQREMRFVILDGPAGLVETGSERR